MLLVGGSCFCRKGKKHHFKRIYVPRSPKEFIFKLLKLSNKNKLQEILHYPNTASPKEVGP